MISLPAKMLALALVALLTSLQAVFASRSAVQRALRATTLKVDIYFGEGDRMQVVRKPGRRTVVRVSVGTARHQMRLGWRGTKAAAFDLLINSRLARLPIGRPSEEQVAFLYKTQRRSLPLYRLCRAMLMDLPRETFDAYPPLIRRAMRSVPRALQALVASSIGTFRLHRMVPLHIDERTRSESSQRRGTSLLEVTVRKMIVHLQLFMSNDPHLPILVD